MFGLIACFPSLCFCHQCVIAGFCAVGVGLLFAASGLRTAGVLLFLHFARFADLVVYSFRVSIWMLSTFNRLATNFFSGSTCCLLVCGPCCSSVHGAASSFVALSIAPLLSGWLRPVCFGYRCSVPLSGSCPTCFLTHLFLCTVLVVVDGSVFYFREAFLSAPVVLVDWSSPFSRFAAVFLPFRAL